MQHRREVILNQPALIPIAGNFDRKPRTLERDVTTVGRARGSDLCLEANEISTLHCIFYRTAEGYRVRDCNSRCGTRVNGEAVKNHTLHDGDIVNLGAFSFEFHLPPALFPKDGAKLDPVQVEHWKSSRRKFAQFALKMRKRVSGGSPREHEWAQKAHMLKEKIRSYDQRLSDLEDAEKELTQERDQLTQEMEKQRQRVQQLESQLAQRLQDADQEIHARWQEFQQRCQAEDARLKPQMSRPGVAPALDDSLAQLRQQTDAERERLHQFEDQLTRQQALVEREQQEFTTMKEQWVKAQTKSSVGMEEQQAALAQQEAGVRAQKAELIRMMGELKKMQDDLRKQPRADGSTQHDALQRENAELRNLVEELQHKVEQAPAPAHNDEVLQQLTHLRTEVELLNDELLSKEKVLQELQAKQASGASSEEVDKLLSENELLSKLLAEKDHVVAELSSQSKDAPKTANDLERYEAELNEFRHQLENDRGKLNKEVEMLRERNKELDEAIREMEMEMSKERAELARERMRLERVREEVKGDTERLQRELAVRNSMAPVQKLRDELAQKQGQAAGKDKHLNDRLRGLRNQLNDSPAGS